MQLLSSVDWLVYCEPKVKPILFVLVMGQLLDIE